MSGASLGQPRKEPAIISVEKTYPSFAQRCHDLAEGQSVYLAPAEIPYDLHRYRDGWYVLWKSPPNGQLGRVLTTREDLALFLNGKWAVGRPLRALVGLRRFLTSEVKEKEE